MVTKPSKAALLSQYAWTDKTRGTWPNEVGNRGGWWTGEFSPSKHAYDVATLHPDHVRIGRLLPTVRADRARALRVVRMPTLPRITESAMAIWLQSGPGLLTGSPRVWDSLGS